MDIFERNYKAVVDRGLITKETKDIDFYYKLLEEVEEVSTSLLNDDKFNADEEITDVVVVGLNWLKHRGCNVEQMLTKIAEKNEKRANL